MVRPIADGSPLNRVCHKPCEITATGSAPGVDDLARLDEAAQRRPQSERREVVARHQLTEHPLDPARLAEVRAASSGTPPARDTSCSCSLRSRYSSHDMPGYMPVSLRGSTKWKLAEPATMGRGLNSRPWIHENTTVLMPMPMPSDPITTAASTGMRAIVRSACCRSFISCPSRARRSTSCRPSRWTDSRRACRSPSAWR